MSKHEHIHKLKRHVYGTGRAIFYCVLDCEFKTAVPLALGKKTTCWRCGKPFNMNEYSLRLVKPHCMECKKTKMEVMSATKNSTNTVNDLLERFHKITNGKESDDLL